jgi:hypothetical protein
MTSALAALANATATFTVPTVGTMTDPVTGNIAPATEAVTVSLYLRQAGTNSSGFPGVDTEVETYEGYAVSPQALDARIKAGITGTLNFAGQGAIECEVINGRFPYGSTGLIGSTLQQVLGDKIRLARYVQG